MRNKIKKSLENLIKELYGLEIEFNIQHPPSPELGDYSSNAAFILGEKLNRNPEKIAEEICRELDNNLIKEVEEKNSFINIYIENGAWFDEIKESIAGDYGRANWGNREKILLEFVSANPTGPLHVASARAAAFGDSLSRILESQGFAIDREYYVNDTGSQIELLGQSIKLQLEKSRGRKVEFPENAYHGDYIKELAEQASREQIDAFTSFGVSEILNMQKQTLNRFRVKFDNWVRESEIKREKKADRIIDDLKLLEPTPFVKKEGALWFNAGDRERVFIRSDGTYTYIVPDIAYHRYKFDRGYDRLIDLLGPDHIDHIPELKTSLGLLGYPENNLEVKIIQWVTLKRGDSTIKMSKRSGEFVTIDELIDEVGVDAARFHFLMRKSSVPMDFDLELAKEQSERNPVYYVQYGHARISSLLDRAKEEGYRTDNPDNLELLGKEEERRLIKKIPEFKEVTEDSATIREPHLIPYYLIDLSKLYHNFYQEIRIVGGEEELTEPRLFLSRAVLNILKRGLELLGVKAPERM